MNALLKNKPTNFERRLKSVVGQSVLAENPITTFLKASHFHSVTQSILDFAKFNSHAASNVLILSADLLTNATNAQLFDFRVFGTNTSAVAALVLRAAAEEELGTQKYSFHDTHSALMDFTISTLMQSEPDKMLRELAGSSVSQIDKLYQAIDSQHPKLRNFCYRLGVHLASEYSASEEFAFFTKLISDRFPKLRTLLESTQHKLWSDVTAFTWLACHEEVEIEHAEYALQACELALKSVPKENLGHCQIVLKRGFRDFYKVRRQFFVDLQANNQELKCNHHLAIPLQTS